MEKIRTILHDLGLKFKFEVAVADKLEDLETKIYALEENRKVKDKALASLDKELKELRMVVKHLEAELRKYESDTKR